MLVYQRVSKVPIAGGFSKPLIRRGSQALEISGPKKLRPRAERAAEQPAVFEYGSMALLTWSRFTWSSL